MRLPSTIAMRASLVERGLVGVHIDAWLGVACVSIAMLVVCACGRDPVQDDRRATGAPLASSSGGPVRSAKTAAKGLEIWFEILPDVKVERIVMHVAVLHFKNASDQPIRIYLPQSEPFRYSISTIVLTGTDAPLWVPEPRPHGYRVTEIDFPLILPGEQKRFEQRFSLDPLEPGGGERTKRRKGFEPGTVTRVVWTYENELTRWEGGVGTLDGPTETLFGGKNIPHIWTGKLSVETKWIAP